MPGLGCRFLSFNDTQTQTFQPWQWKHLDLRSEYTNVCLGWGRGRLSPTCWIGGVAPCCPPLLPSFIMYLWKCRKNLDCSRLISHKLLFSLKWCQLLSKCSTETWIQKALAFEKATAVVMCTNGWNATEIRLFYFKNCVVWTGPEKLLSWSSQQALLVLSKKKKRHQTGS